MGGMQEERHLAMAIPQHCLTLEWASLYPGSVFGVGVSARRLGACLAASAYQTTGKCQSLQAICPLRLTLSHLLLTTEGPGTVPQHKGEAPAGRGRQLSILLLFGSILVALNALWCCQVCGKFAGCCQSAFFGG